MISQGRLKRSLTWLRVRATLVTLSLVLGGTAGLADTATPASAATGNILPPFPTGETWSVCQGYNHGTHTGTSAYGLDLVKNGSGSCDNSSAGATVKAPIDGSVYYYQASYGNLCINIAGGRSYTLTHITSSITSGSVTAGQTVGSVGSAGTYNNNGVAHIHFQMWSAPGCYNGSVMPFDTADGARICGAPDMTSSGPSSGNGTWSGTAFTGSTCGSPPPPPPTQFIVQRQGFNVYAKAGFDDAWVQITGIAADVQVAGTRIAMRDSAHNLYAKEGISGQWFNLINNVDEYVITPNLVVVRKGNLVLGKAGLDDPWVQIATIAIDLQAAGTRIGYRNSAHELFVNDGLTGPWYDEATDVDEFKLTSNYILQRHGPELYAKAGFADAWTHIASNAIDIQASGTLIGNRDAAHHLYVKDGIGGTWYTQADDVDEFVLTPNLIVVREGMNVFGKSSPTSAWVQLSWISIDLQAAGTRVGYRNSAHELFLNDGLTGPWYDEASSVDEFDLS